MAGVFERVAAEVRTQAASPDEQGEALLRKLDRRARLVLGLFSRQDEITTPDIARALGLSERQSRDLLAGWVKQGWLEISAASRRGRRYRLSAEYRRFIGGRLTRGMIL